MKIVKPRLSAGPASLLAVALACLFSLPPPADALPPGKDRFDLRYDVRVAGIRIGHARIDSGKLRKQKSGRIERRVRFRADLRPLGLTALGMYGDGSTWVDSKWRPLRAKWNWKGMLGRTRVRARYGIRGWLDGRYVAKRRTKRIKRKVRGNLNDTISILSWVAGRKLELGKRLHTTTFTGNQVYDVRMSVASIETLSLPIGSREAYRVDVVAKRPGKTRKITMWVDAVTGAPCRMSFEYGRLGAVEALLSGERYK